jgi:hypothetical protein
MRYGFSLRPLRSAGAVPALIAVLVARTQAQTPASIQAAETITAAELARHISVLADDSMQGRDTPSRGLERTAQYIAAQFATAGLTPYTKKGTWFARYPVSPRFDFARSRVVLTGGGKEVIADFLTNARLEDRRVPNGRVESEVLLVAGSHSLASLEQVRERNKIVLYVPPPGASTANPELYRRLGYGNRGIIILSPQDSATFATQVQEGLRRPIVAVRSNLNPRWIIHLRPEAMAGLSELGAAIGLDLVRLRNDTTAVQRELPALRVAFETVLDRNLGDSVTAPVVMGKLQGRDPKLRNSFLFIIAHMDHMGLQPGKPDSIANGADDNASGIAGLLALVKAFSQPGMLPARTVVFAATSGGAKGSWGSHYVAQTLHTEAAFRRSFGGGSIKSAAAVLNLDMIGRPTNDTIAITGLREVEWPTPLAWIAAAHPELRLTIVDGGTLFRPTSEHWPFVQTWSPSLSFQNGRHEDAPDEPPMDVEQAARIVQLAFYVGWEAANTDRPPQFTLEARQRLWSRNLP